jgi:hypothetical protein
LLTLAISLRLLGRRCLGWGLGGGRIAEEAIEAFSKFEDVHGLVLSIGHGPDLFRQHVRRDEDVGGHHLPKVLVGLVGERLDDVLAEEP